MTPKQQFQFEKWWTKLMHHEASSRLILDSFQAGWRAAQSQPYGERELVEALEKISELESKLAVAREALKAIFESSDPCCPKPICKKCKMMPETCCYWLSKNAIAQLDKEA